MTHDDDGLTMDQDTIYSLELTRAAVPVIGTHIASSIVKVAVDKLGFADPALESNLNVRYVPTGPAMLRILHVCRWYDGYARRRGWTAETVNASIDFVVDDPGPLSDEVESAITPWSSETLAPILGKASAIGCFPRPKDLGGEKIVVGTHCAVRDKPEESTIISVVLVTISYTVVH